MHFEFWTKYAYESIYRKSRDQDYSITDKQGKCFYKRQYTFKSF